MTIIRDMPEYKIKNSIRAIYTNQRASIREAWGNMMKAIKDDGIENFKYNTNLLRDRTNNNFRHHASNALYVGQTFPIIDEVNTAAIITAKAILWVKCGIVPYESADGRLAFYSKHTLPMMPQIRAIDMLPYHRKRLERKGKFIKPEKLIAKIPGIKVNGLIFNMLVAPFQDLYSDMQNFGIIKLNEDIVKGYKRCDQTSCMNKDTDKEMEELLSFYHNYPVKLATIENTTRALLWTSDDGRVLLDRIYSSSTKHTRLLQLWADKNKFVKREDMLGNPKVKDMCVSPIANFDDCPVPYIDTLKFLERESKKLHSKAPTGMRYICCVNTNGNGLISRITCRECGALLSEDSCIYIDNEAYCNPGDNNCISDAGCMYCNDCKEYRRSEEHFIEADEYSVCDDCFRDHYTRCLNCDDAFHTNDINRVEVKVVNAYGDDTKAYYICDICRKDMEDTCLECENVFVQPNSICSKFPIVSICTECKPIRRCRCGAFGTDDTVHETLNGCLKCKHLELELKEKARVFINIDIVEYEESHYQEEEEIPEAHPLTELILEETQV